MSLPLTQINCRGKGKTKCDDHIKEELTFACTDCNEILICNTCVSTTHLGHSVIAINLIVQAKFTKLQDLNTDLRESRIPHIRSKIALADEKIEKTHRDLDINIRSAEKHGEYMKKLIDSSTSETVSELKTNASEITEQLERFKLESQNLIKKLEQIIEENRKVTKSENDVLIIDVEKEKSSTTELLLAQLFDVTLAGQSKFVKGTDVDCLLKTSMGFVEKEEGLQFPSGEIERVDKSLIAGRLEGEKKVPSQETVLRAKLKNMKVKDLKEQTKISTEEIVSETFYHRSGKEIHCMSLEGIRYYLDDWGSKEWQPFPKRWYNEGLLITNKVVRNDGQGTIESIGKSENTSHKDDTKERECASGGQADREGVLKHPTRGRIPTHIYQRKHNVHFFYDTDQGQWMRIPIGWELHHDMVSQLVDQIEKMIPEWKDRRDILAMLRQCNYDPDECISTYLHLKGDPWLNAPKIENMPNKKGQQNPNLMSKAK